MRSLIYLLVSEILSEADAKELLRLCKLGRLYDVQGWITSGKSLCLPSNLRTTPLKVALDTGFHSLVELLVRNEPNQELKDRALSHAISLSALTSFNSSTHMALISAQFRSSRCCVFGSQPSFASFSITAPTLFRTLLLRLPLARGFGPQLVLGACAKKNIQSVRLSSKSRQIVK